jgi:septin family protein
MDKVLQMYETMMTRHSTMVVGPTGGGKSVVINTLIKAQTYMGLPTKCTVLNPKVCIHRKLNFPSQFLFIQKYQKYSNYNINRLYNKFSKITLDFLEKQ